ncbi:SRPBCC family protein [Leptospira sp. severe_002]|uniref:SRPBCC family protein n=1 Tax=Leptospira sp. severe_002 TaxID=2838237 RepID=UPI001E314360|nr:SRPBCC family protein [Leptospira sp. severe_002]
MTRTDRASRLIAAPPDVVYRALVDPAMVIEWLPPSGARGSIEEFDPRPGGAFCMTLTFEDSGYTQGKSTPKTDVVKGEFVELETNRRVTQRFAFDSPDPAFAGIMTMTWTLKPEAEGTMLAITADNVPAGIRAEDHEAGLTSSLSNLAAFIEGVRHSPE